MASSPAAPVVSTVPTVAPMITVLPRFIPSVKPPAVEESAVENSLMENSLMENPIITERNTPRSDRSISPVEVITLHGNASLPTGAIIHNRVREILWHIPWYGFKTQARLAQDSGVSPAAISRLIRGESQPSLAVALRLTGALAKRLNRPLDVSEVFSLDGTYPTPSVCHLTGCSNCLPPHFYDEEEQIKPDYRTIKAGEWSAPPTILPASPSLESASFYLNDVSKRKGDL